MNGDIFETDISKEVFEQNYQYGTDDRVPYTWYRNGVLETRHAWIE